MDGFLQLGNASIVGIDIEFEIAAPSVAVAASIDTKFKEQLKKPDDLLAMFKGSGLKHVTQVKIDFKLAQVVSATGATGATGAAPPPKSAGWDELPDADPAPAAWRKPTPMHPAAAAAAPPPA